MSNSESIVDLTQRLVRIPSRAGVDDYGPIVDVARAWLQAREVSCVPLITGSQTVGLAAVIEGAHRHAPSGPVYMLNATLDTAGFGDESRWADPPVSGIRIKDGWLYGRGAADSKAGAAIFCHLLAQFAADPYSLRGTLTLLLDLDEHTGGFAGVRTYFAEASALPRPQGVFIGYPGNGRIVVGSRGFVRATLGVHGHAAHSGGTSSRGINAVTRAARLILRLEALRLDESAQSGTAGEFSLPPQLTVTATEGGAGFSAVPDLCQVSVDMRVTPRFTAAAARHVLQELVNEFDAEDSACSETTVRWQDGWPAYRVADSHPMVRALRSAAEHEFRRPVPTAVVGPSNIGNLLHTMNVPALAGFGVTYRGIHALDECIELDSIEAVYRTYQRALGQLFDDT